MSAQKSCRFLKAGIPSEQARQIKVGLTGELLDINKILGLGE